jgi:hypothetical protein
MNYFEHNAATNPPRTSIRFSDRITQRSNVLRDTTMSKDWLRLRRDQGALMNEMVTSGIERPERVIHNHMQIVHQTIREGIHHAN